MKPRKTLLRSITMLALIAGVAFFASCKKDASVDSFNPNDSVSATRYSGGLYARAGADQTISTSTANLDGSTSSGSISSYTWTQEVGSGGTITSPNSSKTSVTGLSNGGYRFRLTIKNSSGTTVSDTVHVTVSGVSGGGGSTGGNQAPTVSAGSNQTITLPTSSVTLNGSASDADGTIASYLWTKVSGSGGSITSPTTKSTTVTGLSAGTYTFNLKVTDNAGATANSNVNVTVNSSSTPPPTAGYTLTYSDGFDSNSDLDPDGHGQIGGGSLNTLSSFYVTGPGSFKSVPLNVSAGIRSEVQYDASRTANEGAIEYDVMYSTLFSSNGHSFQFHPNTSGGSASPGLWHNGGKFDMVNWKSGTNAHHQSNISIQTNHWYHIRFEFLFGSNGYWRTYIDGALVPELSWTGQVGDGSGQYLKIGVNMWASQSSVVYYDNLKIYKKG